MYKVSSCLKGAKYSELSTTDPQFFAYKSKNIIYFSISKISAIEQVKQNCITASNKNDKQTIDDRRIVQIF